MKLANMKIGRRLALGFALVLVVVAVAITASVIKLHEVKENAEEVKNETLQQLMAAYEVDINTIEISDILTDAIATNNLAGMSEVEKNAEVVRDGLNKFKEMFKRENDAVGYQETVELEAAFERWYKEARKVTETFAANAGAERNQALAALDETREKLIQRVEKLQNAEIEEAEKDTAFVASAAGNTTSLLLILGSLSIIIGIFISFFITRSIAEPVRELCDVAEKLALGDVEVKVAVKSQDEIGQLADAFVRMAGNVKEAALAAEKVAAGDLSVQLAMKSDADILAKSIRTMVGNLQGVITEVGMLTEAAVAGKLATRGKAGTFHGGFREIIEGLNSTLDAVIGPLTVAANYVDRISKGDMPQKISETYQGDFNLIKENLNVLIDAMNKISSLAREVADGNLSVEVKARSDKDELMRSLAEMVSNLQNIVGNVRYGSELIASATRQISAGNSDLSQRTEEQASALEETAASMEELTSTVKQNAENAQHANQLVMNANLVADKGGDVVKRVVVTMDSISESSRKIADIIGVIDGIAFQTNILALNAAVEAARAGEQGRGFAVVAGEVRNLAQRSAAAAKEIKALIIDSTDKVDGGAKLVAEAGQTIDDIVRSVKKVTDIMSEITAASVEQSRGIEQVNQAITQMDEVTQQNATLVEEAAAAAESLEEQAQTLVAAVKKFKVSGSEWDLPAHDVVHEAGKQAKKPLVNNPQRKMKIGAQHTAAAAPRQAKTNTDSDSDHHGWKEF